ncbi:hypothetical protein NP233_g7386 [Leucocoprinus birnbaumii]|uniref:Zn(2)-C6 fungal-type domain-containing protein n=1 Tax=Leucocoprinus birnbaumii TaxID=56174 RepID=A0AAD5VPG7_9AGAR|nr:hypothetical protein NP233_g7386 [Leucocoprinus birnbaumii]
MSPRGASSSGSGAGGSTRSSTTPYSRRPASQPKSTRQQFSACGACRMRRVRCDLKDLVIATAGSNPSCSNCKERNIKCVDEFADVKAVKLLRRGRRLQQVEAVYGKSSDSQGHAASPPTTRLPSIIPSLRPEFFASSFWLWFCIQRPVLDPMVYPSRFYAHTKGTQSLGHEVQKNHPLSTLKEENDNTKGRKHKDSSQLAKWRERKDKTSAMLREILELIDFHGVMRRPTLDGVQALLLILPLLEDAQPLERVAIREATLSQVLALCMSNSQPSGHGTFLNEYNDMLLRARIFWYAHTQEGLATGMSGGRFVLHNDDLDAFQRLIPPFTTESQQILHQQYHERSPLSLAKSFDELTQMTRIPLRINSVCRRVHEVLTGAKAARCAEEHGLIEANGMREIWHDLDRFWCELDAVKETILQDDDATRRAYLEQYACCWQLFIFECHNLIREALKQYISAPAQQIYTTSHTPPRPSSSSSSSSPYLSAQQLFTVANRKCLNRLPFVIDIIKQHLSSSHPDDSTMFRWDTGVIRDGCFFAAYLAATTDSDFIEVAIDDPDLKDSGITASPPRYSAEESVAICMAAFSRMRWTVHRSPPLSMFAGQRRVESAPSTSYTTDGSGTNGWPCYTPPGTATSGSTSTGTGISARGSPDFPNLTPYKGDVEDPYYHSTGSDIDQFSFNVPIVTTVVRDAPVYSQRNLQSEPHAIPGSSSSAYLGQTFTTVSPLMWV